MKDSTYLGTILTNKNELRPVTEIRIKNANWAYYALLPLLKSQSALRAEKIKIHKTLIRPMTMYGAEFWTLNKDIAKRLATLEKKKNVLRRMYGGIKVNANWRKWYNKELMQLFGDLDVLSLVRIIVCIGVVELTEWIVKVKYLTFILREVDWKDDQKTDGGTVYIY